MEQPEKKDNSLLWLIGGLIVFAIGVRIYTNYENSLVQTNSPCSNLVAEEYEECMQLYFAEKDPCTQDSMYGVPAEYSRCDSDNEKYPTNSPTLAIQKSLPLLPTKVIIRACVSGASALNIRQGPGTEYKVVGQMEKGQCADLIGRNSDSTWGRLEGGWISIRYVRSDGNVNNLAVLEQSIKVEPVATKSSTTSQQQPVCQCDANLYDCNDFSIRANAQACYNYCKSIGSGDVHWLDGDNDGVACEK